MNTGPVIALTAAVESLQFLTKLYEEILIPSEVIGELDLNHCFSRMYEKGVWISETLKKQAIAAVEVRIKK